MTNSCRSRAEVNNRGDCLNLQTHSLICGGGQRVVHGKEFKQQNEPYLKVLLFFAGQYVPLESKKKPTFTLPEFSHRLNTLTIVTGKCFY